MSGANLLPLAISMGEPAGIGPDLILQMFARRAELRLPPFVVFGHLQFLRARAERLGLALAFADAAEEDWHDDRLPVVSIPGDVPDRPGETVASSAPVVIAAIEMSVQAITSGRCRALITAPIHKGALYGAGFRFPGHTEFLAALCAGSGPQLHPVMMLAHENYRAVPLTVHVPLAAVPAMISADLIIRTARIIAGDLRERFGIRQPRIAVAGLNPHAGEGGTIGTEDQDTIAPSVRALQSEGIDALGPFPADTLFYPKHWRQYDAVLAMYHDQALIPIKTVAFEDAVNVTLGLPIVRTSPDHGTAFDLAGTGRASASSFVAAIRLADRMTGGIS